MTSGNRPWIDVHGHPGRCFLAGMDVAHPLSVLLDGQRVAEALHASRQAGMRAVGLSTVSDLLVLGADAEGSLRAVRDFAPGEAYADHRRQLDGLVSLLASAGALLVRTAADLEAAPADDQAAVILTCEGADFLEGQVERLAEAHELGVSSVTLVHYRVNEVGDIQTEEPVHGGLTAFGRTVVAEANRLGVLIDCAHATFEVTCGVLEASADPVMISHSHLDHADRHHPRLLSDEHARLVAAAGGLIGAWPAGVTSATLEDFVDEIVRLVELVGVDHVAIGTDMDANFKPVLQHYEQFGAVGDQLAARGMAPAEVDQVLGANALDLYRTVCG
jgi:membrane dipeptidase